MMVTFISQCQKNSRKRTRQVLDAYANRIGDNTWQTLITEEGLMMVKKLLRKTASKNTAVSCHWIRSRRRTELLWVVGNRQKFNSQGHVPVNRTEKKIIVKEMEDDWRYLPIIKGLTAIATLLHDWGKCSDLFQKKLAARTNKFKGDPLRHEWISSLLLQSLVRLSGDLETDQGWLELFASNQWDEQKLIKEMEALLQSNEFTQLKNLPPFAQMVIWMILSHHKMPDLRDEYGEDGQCGYTEFSDDPLLSLTELFEVIRVNWGYENNFDDDFKKRLPQCFRFSQGLLKNSPEWISGLKRWSKKILAHSGDIQEVINNGSWRAIIQYSRLSLMLGDHYVSSLLPNSLGKQQGKKPWRKTTALMANTDRKTAEVNQYLDEHLYSVYQQGLQVAQFLKNLTFEMPAAHDLNKIKAKSPTKFIWQDNAVNAIKKFRKQTDFNFEQGFFIVNMASTGTGKTIANAKIMQALSEDNNSLRYILALGLRTLTLQTGDSYRENLGMEKEDLAVLIGSSIVQELHEDAKKQKNPQTVISNDIMGSESLEALMDDEIEFPQGAYYPEFMEVLFPKNEGGKSEKSKAFLFQPILVCTIDHIMGATETTRGGKYLLPYLRLLSSDLVIDEVDDFSVEDFIPLARLVHLAGMLGRKVMISSATIPPSLASGLFNAYQKGFAIFASFRNIQKPMINAMWVDEFKSTLKAIPLVDSAVNLANYQQQHDDYIEWRCQKLFEQTIKQRAYIIPCEYLQAEQEEPHEPTRQSQYFELIKDNIEYLHQQHHTVDMVSGKKISFGVVRVANIPPCVALTRYLLNADWDKTIAPRVMAYHSRQVLLLRSIQEQHLDAVLSRKEKVGEAPKAFNDPIIRAHIDQCAEENVIFILVATPVEEVGRDHDFDWAVIEPSSYRSIIQLSGRVRRHRSQEQDITAPNIALMQFNLKGLHNKEVAFNRPGFESSSKRFKLTTKNLSQLIEHQDECLNINAIPRIKENKELLSTQKLADLEHARIRYFLMNKQGQGARYLHGWLDEAWFLTGLPQRFYRFRKSSPDIQLFAVYQENGISFCERNDDGDWISRNDLYNIQQINLSDDEMKRSWFKRDYQAALYQRIQSQVEAGAEEEVMMERASKRYGEILIPEKKQQREYWYSDQLGLFY